MSKIALAKSLTYSLLFILFLYSCEEGGHPAKLLEQAQTKIEDNPSEALLLLDSIRNPSGMDQDSYMRYVLLHVQAKSLMRKDIKSDTLVFDAQRYFDTKNDPYMSALAHYYSAGVYHANNTPDKELEHFMLAGHYARKAGNNLLMGKSRHSIGNLYYEKGVMDSAIVNYKQALDYYAKNGGMETFRLQVMRFTGIAYQAEGKLDSAYYYFDEGLRYSKELDNVPSQVSFTHMLGMLYRKKGDHQKSADYLRTALAETTDQQEAIWICLRFLKLYHNQNQPDSAKYYSDLMKEHLAKITYPRTLEDLYKSLSSYHEENGDYKEALHYNNLLLDVTRQINESNSLQKLSEADKKYKAALHKKELDSLLMRNYLYLLGGISLVLIVLVVAYFNNRTMRLKRQRIDERNKLLEEQSLVQQKLLEHQDESLTYMQGIYRNIVTEWVEIDKQVKSLAKEFGAKEEPELYVKIKKMVESFRQNTNEQLVGQAKEHFQKQPYGENVLLVLKDKELLLFMLYYCGYKRNDVAVLLGVRPHKENMNFRKLDLRNKLLKAGMPKEDVEQILFAEDKED